MHEWMDEGKKGGIEAGRKSNMELEGGGKKARRKRGKIWKSNHKTYLITHNTHNLTIE